jgi:hypothetical protein
MVDGIVQRGEGGREEKKGERKGNGGTTMRKTVLSWPTFFLALACESLPMAKQEIIRQTDKLPLQ